MENVKLNLLKKTKLSSPTSTNGHHTYFVICNSCYWCASYFNIDGLESRVIGCNVCNSRDTELMPIGSGESFRIDYNPIRSAIMVCK